MRKLVYGIRHGTALHNVNFKKLGVKAYTDYEDSPLVKKGVEEATKLGNLWKNINDVQLVVVSPLYRTLQTAHHIFQNTNIPIVVLDNLKEHPQSAQYVNKRSSKSYLQRQYPYMDFSDLTTEEDEDFAKCALPNNIELSNLNHRISSVQKWLLKRPETVISIISHDSFLSQMLFNKLNDEVTALKHCFPYEYILEH